MYCVIGILGVWEVMVVDDQATHLEELLVLLRVVLNVSQDFDGHILRPQAHAQRYIYRLMPRGVKEWHVSSHAWPQ